MEEPWEELDHHHHHHHPQQRREHLQGFAAAAAAAPPPPASSSIPPDPDHVQGSRDHAWNYSGCLLQLKDDDPNGGGAPPSPPADPKQGYEALLLSPRGTSMVHDLGVDHWPCASTADSFQGHFCGAAEELPADSFLKLARFGAAAWNPPPSTGKYEQQQLQVLPPDVNGALLSHTTDMLFQLPTRTGPQDQLAPSPSSSSCSTSSVCGGAATAFERLGSYTKMLLAANAPSSPPFPGSFSMQELHALELLASARFGAQIMASSRQPSLGNVAFFGEGVACGMDHHLPSPSQGSPASNEPQKMSSLPDGVKEGKRSANGGPEQCKASPAPVAKRAKAEPRSSSTSPLKVRKEKLGDRVAALQQLVAPFGKTDTASVLTEAVGYIKFLQEQVQTLSMPYLRSTSKNQIRTTQAVPNEEKDATKQDLRSRGLCLVPLSYTSYFTSENGSTATASWSPSYFRGAY